MYKLIVQALCLLALLAVLGGGIVMLAKLMTSKKGRSVFGKFVLVEMMLFASAGLINFLKFGKIQSISGFIIGSIFLAMFLNIPAAIIAKIVSFFLRGRRTPDTLSESLDDNE